MNLEELVEYVMNLEAQLKATETELIVTRSLLNTTQVDLQSVESFLDFNCGIAPLTESGKLTWDVIELRTQLTAMDQKYFGKNIDAMVDI